MNLPPLTFGNIVTVFLASVLIWLLFILTLMLGIKKPKIKTEFILHALFSAIASWTVAYAVKKIIPSIRPFGVNGFDTLTLTTHFDNTFPSGHTALAFGLAVALYMHDKKLGIIYLMGAVLVGLGRIWANVHYPIDIVGGAVLGIFIALVTEGIFIRRILKEK